ncbi:MAG: hypothetical protein ABIO55_11670 [Ginsengibacter sp.]
MNLFFPAQVTKEEVFSKLRTELINQDFNIKNDERRPWGGFFVIEEKQAPRFLEIYFFRLNKEAILAENKLSPKILIVEAHKRLSWQFHHRRAEIWKVIGGNVGVVRSDSDEENPVDEFETGDIIKLKRGQRHRLVGMHAWGVVAEIWQHTDEDNPSDEDDIVRLSDDFGR